MTGFFVSLYWVVRGGGETDDIFDFSDPDIKNVEYVVFFDIFNFSVMSDQNVGNVVFIRHFMSKIRSKNVGNVVIFDIFGQNFAQKMSEMSYFSTFCSIASLAVKMS